MSFLLGWKTKTPSCGVAGRSEFWKSPSRGYPLISMGDLGIGLGSIDPRPARSFHGPQRLRCSPFRRWGWENTEESHYHSYTQGIDGFKSRQNLAVVYEQMGELQKAEEQWRKIVTEVPRYRGGWGGLAENLLAQEKLEEAKTLVNQLLKDKFLALEGLILRSRLATRRQDFDSTERDLRQAVLDFPDNQQSLEALCRFLFEHRNPVAAEQPLNELIRLDPDNAAAQHNLGTVYKLKGEFESAAAAYRESLHHRPNWPPTCFELGGALKASGKIKEAIEAWEHGQRLDPGNEEIRQALLHATKETKGESSK